MVQTMITLEDFRKVEKSSDSYIKTALIEQRMSQAWTELETITPSNLATFQLLLDITADTHHISQELHEHVSKILKNWHTAPLKEQFALALLVRETKDDTALWDYLLLSE